jgi:hypothetical protein
LFWEKVRFKADFLDSEDIVAKLHFVEEMEARWPYGPAKGIPFPDRIGRALSQLPERLQPYALAVFANVAYLPEPLLRTSWSFLGQEAARALDTSWLDLIENALLLEVDPSGLVSDFLHENEVHGRLDTDRFARVQSVDDLATTLLLLQNPGVESSGSLQAARLSFSRPIWLILSDNVLSGTSLSSDLTRARSLVETFGTNRPCRLVAVAQVLTSDAEQVLKTIVPDVVVVRALYFDERFKVSPVNPNCSLFVREDTMQGVLELCEWLAVQEWFAQDKRLAATIAKSGDNMAYGFKGGGWTIVTPNCPTNSLPILWYEQAGHYEAPFPRIMSRTSHSRGYGGESVEAAIAAAVTINSRLNDSGGLA